MFTRGIDKKINVLMNCKASHHELIGRNNVYISITVVSLYFSYNLLLGIPSGVEYRRNCQNIRDRSKLNEFVLF